MSPRILDLDRCRHCKADLERPTPRVCPACGGSLQKRHLALGCLTSAPPPVLLLALLGALFRGERAPAPPDVDATVAVAVDSAAGASAPPRERGEREAPAADAAEGSAVRTTRAR